MTSIQEKPEFHLGLGEENSAVEKIFTLAGTETLTKENAGGSMVVNVETESVTSCVEEGRGKGVRKEDAPCQETVGDDEVSIQVTIHVEDDESSSEEEEIKSSVAARIKDRDLQDQSETLPPPSQGKTHLVNIMEDHPISGGEASLSDKRSPSPSSRDFFSNTKHVPFHQIPHQHDNLSTAMQKERSFMLSNEMLHTGVEVAVKCEKSLDNVSENFVEEVVEEDTSTCDAPLKNQSGGMFHLKKQCKTVQKERIGKTRFKCELCGNTSKQKCNCKPNEMSKGEKRFKCEICAKSFVTRWSWKLHERTHTGEKPFKCQFCEKMFSRKQVCKIHERTHTGEKPFKCQFCEKAFVQKNKCKQHERMHTGERPYKCLFCDKLFNSKQDCKTHEMLHTGEKPFKCQFCEKMYTRKQACQRHEMVHTGEKPYKCHICEKTFARSTTCRQHENTHIPRESPKIPILFFYSSKLNYVQLSGQHSLILNSDGAPKQSVSGASTNTTLAAPLLVRD